MKKILLLMAIALPFVFISSCGDDKDKDEPVTPDNHEYVDLGLPSGTLWATCNIGATIPEGMGDYFAWGETAPKEIYDMDNYKWYNSSSDKLTKYCTDGMSVESGLDGLEDLGGRLDELGPDVAYAHSGSTARTDRKMHVAMD